MDLRQSLQGTSNPGLYRYSTLIELRGRKYVSNIVLNEGHIAPYEDTKNMYVVMTFHRIPFNRFREIMD